MSDRYAVAPRGTYRTQPTPAGWIAIIVFALLAAIGAIGAVAAIGVYSSLASGLADPHTMTDYALRPGNDHLRPDGQDRARSLRDRQARERHL